MRDGDDGGKCFVVGMTFRITECEEKIMSTDKTPSSTSVDSIVRRPGLSKIEPQPKWEETPMLSDAGLWCGRYRTCRQLRDGYGEISVEVDAVRPPSEDVSPVEHDGAWYWGRNRDDGKCDCGQNWYTCVCSHDDD